MSALYTRYKRCQLSTAAAIHVINRVMITSQIKQHPHSAMAISIMAYPVQHDLAAFNPRPSDNQDGRMFTQAIHG